MSEPAAEDGQRRLEEAVAWWSVPLGLSGWRFAPSYGAARPGAAAHTWRADDYPHATIAVRGTENAPDHEPWRHWPVEESAVHELLHMVTRELDEVVEKAIIPATPAAARKAFRRLWDHQREAVVEALARALVAARHADPGGPPPAVGGIVPPGEDAA